jgi:NAD(P)-dependent dehydrogenase (short-subunit alcohol dehydrogenase family)
MRNGNLLWVGGAFLAGLAVANRLGPTFYSFRNKVVVITGGSRGLGLTLASQLAREGAQVVLLARKEDELNRAERLIDEYGGSAVSIPCDVRDRDQVTDSIRRVIDRFGRIDVLINNAGVIQVGPMEHMNTQDYRDSMDIHFWAAHHTMETVIPYMRQQHSGRIVNIASIGGEIGVPHLAPYCASKYALVGLSDSIRAEVARHGIAVTTVCPWLMRTGSYPTAIFKGQFRKEYTWFALSDSAPGVAMKAQKAARRIIEAARRGQARLTLGWQGKLAVFLNAVAPSVVATGQRLANRMMPNETNLDGDRGRTGLQAEWEGAPKVTNISSHPGFNEPA